MPIVINFDDAHEENDMTTEKKPQVILTPTALTYLHNALEKGCDKLHPNFKAKLKPETLNRYNSIRTATARSWDANKGDNPRAIALGAARALSNDVTSYITYWKDVMSNAAFAAHMDVNRLNKHIDPSVIEQGLDAMGETHNDGDAGDVAIFDVGDSTRAASREEYAGGADEIVTVAEDVTDAYDAIEALQAWIGLAMGPLTPDNQQYWQVDGLFPLGQQVETLPSGEKTYSPIRDFDAYRAYQDAEWKRKQRVVTLDDNTLDLMASM